MKNALISLAIAFSVTLFALNVPAQWFNVSFWLGSVKFGSAFTQLAGGNQLSAFPTTYNANLALTANTSAANIFTAANSFSALAQFTANASTTELSCYGPCYFGATATSSFSSAGILSLISPLGLGSGGTAASSFTTTNNSLYYTGSALATSPTTLAITTPYASTTALSSSASAWFATGGGSVGIATSSPGGLFSLQPSGGISALFLIGSSTPSQPILQVTPGRQTATCLDTYGLAPMPATSTAMVVDWVNTCPAIDIKVGTAAFSITFINATTSNMAGSRKLITVCNSASAAGAVTWVGTEWYGSLPTQTTTANQCDTWSFHVTSATSTLASPAYKIFGAQSAAAQ